MAINLAQEPEIKAKEEVIKQLKEIAGIIKKYGGEKPISEDFCRGYISGYSSGVGIKIPTHWYDEILQKSGCEAERWR